MKNDIRKQIEIREQKVRKSRFHSISRERIASVIHSVKDGQGRILEVGCGHADVAVRYVAPNCSELVITDKQQLCDPAALPENTCFMVEDSMQLSFADESFDGIYSVEVIEHVPDPEQFLREGLRVLRTGGTLFFTTPNRHRLTALARWLAGKPIRFPHTYAHDTVLGDITHVREFSLGDLNSLLEGLKFSQKEIRGIYFGVPQFNLGIGMPPSIMQRFAFNWHVRLIK